MKFFALAFLLPLAASANTARDVGLKALNSMTGCYLIDYSYTETESLKPGYDRDHRVYDVNKDKSVKEWIYAIDLGPNKLRLQHILFAADLEGKVYEESFLRHQAEDWEFDAPFLYDFTSPSHWDVKKLEAGAGLWTRRVTNLDDGLRYQCAAAWNTTNAYPEWTCDNYAPIPGRETRDMGRKDYNTLERSTRIMAYGNSWLERQANTKVIHKDGVKTPLAKELGKNWYVRLPDSECAPVLSFRQENEAFWNLTREVWEEVLTGDRPFIETMPVGSPPRYARMMLLQDRYPDLSQPETRAAAKAEIRAIIQDYRAN